MTMIVKIMSNENSPDLAAEKGFSLIAGVKRFNTFSTRTDGASPRNWISMWVEDPTKTAEVPGFVEHELIYDVFGNVYIMNETGKTMPHGLHQFSNLQSNGEGPTPYSGHPRTEANRKTMSFLDAFEGYDKPYRLTLKHPATGEPMLDKEGVAAYIDIYAQNSVKAQEWRKSRFNEAKKDAKKNKKPDPTFEEATAKGAEFYATLTADWYLVHPVTKEGDAEFSFDKAVEVYADRRASWLVNQLNEALEDDANFLT